jgi:2OG-Fe(II) oxygenase superfamily
MSDHVVLYDKIWVFPQAFKNAAALVEHARANYEWTEWYTFGKHCALPYGGHFFDEPRFPAGEEWDKMIAEVDDPYNVEVLNLWHDSAEEYVNYYGIQRDNWVVQRLTIANYEEDKGVSEELAMNFHTDFQQEKVDEPGDKFVFTCLIYLNDDYEGGEIIWKVVDDTKTKQLARISYKPKAGDIVIFPSAPPYYHGVKSVKGDKLFLRGYWKSRDYGSAKWHAGVEKYGAEEWGRMQQAEQTEKAMSGLYSIWPDTELYSSMDGEVHVFG